MSRQSSSDPLPYVQVDRAVKPKAALLAGIMRESNQHALGSLVEWWELCGDPRELEAIVRATTPGAEPAVVLSGADVARRFRAASGHVVAPDDLATLGLVEPLEGDRYRVRGMSRYFAPVTARLRARAVASAGGKASAVARKAAFGSAQPRSGPSSGVGSGQFEPTRTDSEPTPEPTPEPARTDAEPAPNPSGQRSAVISLKVPATVPVAAARKARKADKATDPRHAPTVTAVVEAFSAARGSPYPFAKRDARAVTALLAALGSTEAVAAAWSRALEHQGYPAISTLSQLVGHLGCFVGSHGAPRPSVGGRPPPSAICVACGAPAPSGWVEQGAPTCHEHALAADDWCQVHGLVVYEGGAAEWLQSLTTRHNTKTGT